jgi:hypothetical protein
MTKRVMEQSKNYPEPGQKYKHYKGGTYEVITLATHTESSEPMVVYKSLLFGSIYVRPLDIWNSLVAECNSTRFTKLP